MPCTTWNSQQAGFEEICNLPDPSGNSTPATQSATHPPIPAPMSTSQHTPAHISLKDDDEFLSKGQQFVKAVGKILETGGSSKPKLQEPDPFNGSDSHKLSTFILQCRLNFQDHPDLFKDDKFKVNYVLSFLKGTAIDCFEPMIQDPA